MEFAWPGYLPCLGCPQCLTSRFLEGKHLSIAASVSLRSKYLPNAIGVYSRREQYSQEIKEDRISPFAVSRQTLIVKIETARGNKTA